MSEIKTQYDIIIAGGGAAGLSLAYRLFFSSLKGLRVLIVDSESKTVNDRTWCFWNDADDLFPEIIRKSWSKIVVRTKTRELVLKIDPYRYQMIRGIDFYNHVNSILRQERNFVFLNEEIIAVRGDKDHAVVYTTRGSYSARLIFNSLPAPIPDTLPGNRNFLLQHFKGYYLETPTPAFDPDMAYFMDFSVPQNSETRFGYVLPLGERNALVEFTIFSENLLSEEEYERLLNDYIHQNLGIGQYKIHEKEFGIIPMTDLPFRRKEGKTMVNIGLRGGSIKGSTGFAFKQIQQDVDEIVKNLEKSYPVVKPPQKKSRFRFYDSIFLHVLVKSLYPADEVFFQLFNKNRPQKILKFLEEKTSWVEDFRILSSVPLIPFIRGTFRAIFTRGVKKNKAKQALQELFNQ